ncbi:YmfL family putative regulatory protein [Undibacterium curvum]|uniref:YmfL family putative regulatory protein n=1 Tax=Undibacterium curvum TaxID=2762294 RepID=UPI003D0E5CD4
MDMIGAYPGGWDAMAGALGMTRDALSNRIYERKGQGILVQTAMEMQEFSGTTIFAAGIAAMSSGTFVKLPDVDHIGNEEITGKFHEIFEEMGKLSANFREFTSDGVIDPGEQESLNDLIDRMHRTMDELRALTFKVYCPETKAATVAKRGEKHV